jgi:hypothetical protein
VRALALLTTLLAVSAQAAERRGAFVVTHDPLPRAQVEALHARGTKLLVYEWSVAFSPGSGRTRDRSRPREAAL